MEHRDPRNGETTLKSTRPWGDVYVVVRNLKCSVDLTCVRRGGRSSLHSHKTRYEIFHFLDEGALHQLASDASRFALCCQLRRVRSYLKYYRVFTTYNLQLRLGSSQRIACTCYVIWRRKCKIKLNGKAAENLLRTAGQVVQEGVLRRKRVYA